MDSDRIIGFVDYVAANSHLERFERHSACAGDQIGLRSGRFCFTVTGRMIFAPGVDLSVEDRGDYHEAINQSRITVSTTCIELFRDRLINLLGGGEVESIAYGPFYRLVFLNGNQRSSQTISAYVESLLFRIISAESASANG